MAVALTGATLRVLEVPAEGLPALVEQAALLVMGAVGPELSHREDKLQGG